MAPSEVELQTFSCFSICTWYQQIGKSARHTFWKFELGFKTSLQVTRILIGHVCTVFDLLIPGLFHTIFVLSQGKIKVKETISNGFDKLPTAFIEMLSGKNVGKAVVRV